MNSIILKISPTASLKDGSFCKTNWMAYSELPRRPFLWHQAWSWTTLRRGNVFYYVYKRFFYFWHVFYIFDVFSIFIWTFFYICVDKNPQCAGCTSIARTSTFYVDAWNSHVVLLVSDAWPVRRQTYGYLPSRRALTAPWPVVANYRPTQRLF